MQACCRWHPIDALVVVVRSRWVQACRCDTVDAPPRCGKSDLDVVLPRRRRVQQPRAARREAAGRCDGERQGDEHSSAGGHHGAQIEGDGDGDAEEIALQPAR